MAGAFFIIPLTILPLIVFNIVGVVHGPGAWDGVIFDMTMVSGQHWSFTARDLMVVFGIACLFGEVLKSTNTTSRAIVNHILSTLVFIVYLVEFIIVNFAAEFGVLHPHHPGAVRRRRRLHHQHQGGAPRSCLRPRQRRAVTLTIH